MNLPENIQFWDRISGVYDFIVRRMVPGWSNLLDRIAEDVGHCEKALEVATGPGDIALRMAYYCDFVEAVDTSEKMIAKAWEKARQNRAENVLFDVQNAYQLQYDRNTFDAVVCANALHCMTTPEKALSEIRRVLKPGGKLIAPTFCHGQHLSSLLISHLVDFTGFKAYHRFQKESLLYLLLQSGFKIQEAELLPATIPLLYVLAE
ncbi:methyltransferase domain-containing protein [Desulfobacterales bacterium HSG17]|nr:methyltransferase domain-containing protein [Desulfobacterales bacterium HSG17]